MVMMYIWSKGLFSFLLIASIDQDISPQLFIYNSDSFIMNQQGSNLIPNAQFSLETIQILKQNVIDSSTLESK